MHRIKKVPAVILLMLLATTVLPGSDASAKTYPKERWFYPSVTINETYDDNIFLEKSDGKFDWVTTLSPRVRIKPFFGDHKVIVDYLADLKYFAKYHDQNSDNHTVSTVLELNYNKFLINCENKFRNFSERSGAEDVNRVDRMQDHGGIHATYNFAKTAVTAGYNYKLEDYRSDMPIGVYQGRDLTYQDLDRSRHEGDFELETKIWPKASAVLFADYGGIIHDTAGKSDSKYFDVMAGVRGKVSAKIEADAKIGIRAQGYDNYSDDYVGVVFDGNIIARFTRRDVLRLDLLRTTRETTYMNNAYYVDTFAGIAFKHGFTKKFSAGITGSYQRADYPTNTVESGVAGGRSDNTWMGGCMVEYEMPLGVTVGIRYDHVTKDSSFSSHGYRDNRVSINAKVEV